MGANDLRSIVILLMKIALGTTSKMKLVFLESVLSDLLDDFEVVTVNVESGVSDQPLSYDETVKGATNRAVRSFNEENVDIAIGMEGGSHKIGDKYYYFGSVVIHDGENQYHGLSDSLPLPQVVSDGVDEGGYIGNMIRDYLEENDDDESFKEFAGPIVGREPFFDLALRNAVKTYLNKRHYV